jgi:hypothetical protein
MPSAEADTAHTYTLPQGPIQRSQQIEKHGPNTEQTQLTEQAHLAAPLLEALPEAQAGLMAAAVVHLGGLVKEAEPAAQQQIQHDIICRLKCRAVNKLSRPALSTWEALSKKQNLQRSS